MNCPCQSGQTYDRCCGRFITHRELPENATLLMRSRYSAFALAERDYLLDTWHPDFRPQRLELDIRIRWLGLDIIASEQRGQREVVEFKASLLLDGEVSSMHERSAFIFQQRVFRKGRWIYTSGEQLAASFAPWKPSRNQNCPCGSGHKFKRCCAND